MQPLMIAEIHVVNIADGYVVKEKMGLHHNRIMHGLNHRDGENF